MRLLPLLLTGAYGLMPIAEVDNSVDNSPIPLDKRQAPPEVSQIVDATKDLTQDPAWQAIGQLLNGGASMDPEQKSSEAAAAQTEIQSLLTKYYSSIPNWQSIVSTASPANQGNANPPANGPAGGNGGNPLNGGPQSSGNNLMNQLISAQAAASRQLASASAASAASSAPPPAPATALVVPASAIPTREPDGIAGTLPGVVVQSQSSQSSQSSSQNTAPAGNIAGTRTGLMILQGPTSTISQTSSQNTAPAGNIAGTRSGLIVLQNTNTAKSSASSTPPAAPSTVVVPPPSPSTSGGGNIAGTRSGFVVVGNTASGNSGNSPSTVTQTAATPTDATGALLQGIAGLLGGGAAGALGNLVGGSSIATPTGGTLPTAPASGSQSNHPEPGPDGVVTITITPGSMFPKATTFVNSAVSPKKAAPLLAVSLAALIPLLL